MARLRAVMDQKDGQSRERVGCAFLSDSHKPDRCEMLPFLQDPNRNAMRRYYLNQARRLRRFRAPIPASVEVADEAPSVVHFQRVRRRVTSASGPWRLGIEWWNHSAEWSRNEWNVELRSPFGTGVYRIFQDHLAKWFVEGIYD
jgi:protein ImuB